MIVMSKEIKEFRGKVHEGIQAIKLKVGVMERKRSNQVSK